MRADDMDLYGMATIPDVLDWIRARCLGPLYLCVSGSHSNGLNRPDSDLDIRGIYADPLEKVLGLHPGRDTIEALDILGGNVDIQLYELKKALKMLNNHNGNVVHMLLMPTCFYDSLMVDWRGLADKYLTKRLNPYFRGYYYSQRKRAAENRGGKSLLYCYREILTGIMLMRTGEWIFPFMELKQRFEETFGWHSYLLDRFLEREDWKQPVSADRLNDFAIEWEKLVALLDEETKKSSLPDDYDGCDELNRILWDYRLGNVFFG